MFLYKLCLSIPRLLFSMAPPVPEHATSAVDEAYDAFTNAATTLKEMVDAKLSPGSITRQTHVSLDRAVSWPRWPRGLFANAFLQMGIVPFTSSLVETIRHDPKEQLYWLRDLCKEAIRAKTFVAPVHSMSQLYKMLEAYEAHREANKTKRQPPAGSTRSKKVCYVSLKFSHSKVAFF